MNYFSFLAKQPYLCWLHSRLEYSSSNVCYQWSPRNIHPPHVMIVTRDTSSPSEWQVRLLGKMFEEKKKKMMFETRSLDEFYINFVQLDYTRLELFSSYLRFFARIWFRSCKICDAVDLEKQTNAGAIRRLENKTWGFFWIRWCCRHFLPFQLCHNINIVTTLSQQTSQLCHNKCHNFVITNVTKTMQKFRWWYQEMMTMTLYFRNIFASNFDDSYF